MRMVMFGLFLCSAALTPITLGKTRSLTGMYRGSTAQIRQRKCGSSIAAEGYTEKREQCRILRDWQGLAVTEGPAPRSEISVNVMISAMKGCIPFLDGKVPCKAIT